MTVEAESSGQARCFVQGEQLVKRYGTDHASYDALRGIDFRAAAGEFVAIRGPSGCGKSTLLHLLGAMDRPSSGEVWLAGERLDALTLDALALVRRRQVGFVFQMFNLLPSMTVTENVALPLLLDGVSETEAMGRSKAALQDVDLVALSEKLPSQLSGGEMQRTAIARALAIDPKLVIADEPTGSLDSTNGRLVLELLQNVNSSKGITVLMATHSEEAAAFAHRSVHLRDGKIHLERETSNRVVSAPL